MQPSKIIVEKHPDGYVAYPVGMNGIVIGEGDTYEEAVADVTSASGFITKRSIREAAIMPDNENNGLKKIRINILRRSSLTGRKNPVHNLF